MLSLLVSHKQGWSVVTWLLTLAAGVVPFAFLLVEQLLQKEMQKASTRAS